jgi:hypothetical protein
LSLIGILLIRSISLTVRSRPYNALGGSHATFGYSANAVVPLHCGGCARNDPLPISGRSVVEAITKLAIDFAGIVPMEAAERNTVVQQDAAVGDV